jgi:hypothetical protein
MEGMSEAERFQEVVKEGLDGAFEIVLRSVSRLI